LGQELRNLHTQFDIQPREENSEVYTAINAQPILQNFEGTLIPLLDAYEYKIQEFEHGFETVHEEFFTLEKKYDEICRENEELRAKLTDKIKELVEVYQRGNNQQMHSDFGNIILEQINEKQRVLVDQNAILERDYQRSKAEAERANSELGTLQNAFS
jgi:flagellar biosynthesis chaperone FliJ